MATDDKVQVAFLPRTKYRVVETEEGWEVWADDTHGAFY